MQLLKYRMSLAAAVAVVAVVTLAGCGDRRAPAAASSGEYSNPSQAAPAASSDPVAVPGKGTDVTAKGSGTGMVGGASGTVGSGGTPGSGSSSGAGTGAAVSSQSTPDTKK